MKNITILGLSDGVHGATAHDFKLSYSDYFQENDTICKPLAHRVSKLVSINAEINDGEFDYKNLVEEYEGLENVDLRDADHVDKVLAIVSQLKEIHNQLEKIRDEEFKEINELVRGVEFDYFFDASDYESEDVSLDEVQEKYEEWLCDCADLSKSVEDLLVDWEVLCYGK
jgi:hypothetical protein